MEFKCGLETGQRSGQAEFLQGQKAGQSSGQAAGNREVRKQVEVRFDWGTINKKFTNARNTQDRALSRGRCSFK